MVLTTREPTPDYEAAVLSIVSAATDADGVDPLNEAGYLALHVPGAAIHWLVEDGVAPAAYAQWHLTDRTGVVVVHPAHRGRGLARDLMSRVAARAGDDLALWAFGDRPAARAFAQVAGLKPARVLHQMSRPLDKIPEPDFPPDVTVREFTPDDLSTLHRLNSLAFAAHPEQGQLTVGDLRQRMAESWFDPAGLLLADQGGITVGFHWTKRESPTVGEVYVLGVDPQAAGRGLGRALLWAGLQHLKAVGCRQVELFVDDDNTTAVELYTRSDFVIVRTDVLYQPTQGDPNDQRGP